MTKEEKAQQYFDKAKKANQRGDYTAARNHLEKTIELKSNWAEAYNDLALLLENHFQEYEKAKEYFEKVIELEPDLAEAYVNLAILLKEHFGENEKAQQYFDKYLLLRNPSKARKITGISLKNYNQFGANVSIDLTYPKGHKKAGQPLDKVCFIGQSGTGKTSILQLIKSYISGNSDNTPNATFQNVIVKFQHLDLETKHPLINFPPYAVENIKRLDAQDAMEYRSEKLPLMIDFEEEDPKKHWYPILKKITEYQNEAIKYSSQLGYDSVKVKDVKRFEEALKNYEAKMAVLKKSNNSLEDIASFLNPLLTPLYLKVKTDPSAPEEMKFVPIEKIEENTDNEAIKNEHLSTGTKQILARSIPLYALKPQHSVILVDEPENSLYPDMQKQFIDFITEESWNRVKNCQFFFATHSPTIASSFEPWEIVELKFNENGKIEQELYYKGERHVDNFAVFPKYLDIDSILLRIFDIEELNKERKEKLDQFAVYNIKLQKLEKQDKQHTEEYKALKKKRNELGDKLDWQV